MTVRPSQARRPECFAKLGFPKRGSFLLAEKQVALHAEMIGAAGDDKSSYVAARPDAYLEPAKMEARRARAES